MKLLKGRKLLKAPKMLGSSQAPLGYSRGGGGFWGKLKKNRVLIFNLLVIVATVGFLGYYLWQREGKKETEAEKENLEAQKGEAVKEEFYETVFEEEIAESQKIKEEEERRKEAMSALLSSEEGEEQAEEESESESEEEAIEVPILEQVEKGDDSEWHTYENQAFKYSIKYPAEWFIDKDTRYDSWLAYITSYDPLGIDRSASPPNVKIEILVQENIRSLSLDEWVDEGHKLFGDPLSYKKIEVAEIEAYQEEIEYPEKSIAVYFIKDKNVYTISYIGPEPGYTEYQPVFYYILSHFQIIK